MDNVKSLPKFKAQQVIRQIEQLGSAYTFTRYVFNKYGETTDTVLTQILVTGIFHTQKTYVARTVGDATSSVKKDTPMLMMTYKEFAATPLVYKDVVQIDGTKYEVLDATNIAGMDFAMDISLGELR